jgi:Periplasmic binding protein
MALQFHSSNPRRRGIMTRLLGQTTRAYFALFGALALSSLVPAQAQAQSTTPIRIGSTLALTGPLSATAMVHKLVGEIYIEQLNKRGGLLGRQVEWNVKDDQSKPDLARTLYEQLVTADKVDLLMGPYATGAILSAMGVAQRYNKLLVHHTMGIPSLAKYEMQFPAWSLGAEPGKTVPATLLDALGSLPKPPKTVAVVTSKFPSVHFLTLGFRQPRFWSDCQSSERRQTRFCLGWSHWSGGQPATRRHEKN